MGGVCGCGGGGGGGGGGMVGWDGVWSFWGWRWGLRGLRLGVVRRQPFFEWTSLKTSRSQKIRGKLVQKVAIRGTRISEREGCSLRAASIMYFYEYVHSEVCDEISSDSSMTLLV